MLEIGRNSTVATMVRKRKRKTIVDLSITILLFFV
jgi:hypothetical protein